MKKSFIFIFCILLLGVDGSNYRAENANIYVLISKQREHCEYFKDLDTFVVDVPGKDGIILSSDSCKLLTGDDVAKTVDMFYDKFKKKFGDPEGKLKRGLSSFSIHLSSKPKKVKNVYSTGGKKLKEAYVNGLFFGPSYIWLHVVPGSSVEDTALVHELMHYALLLTKGEADADHEGDKYHAWTKEHTKLLNTLNYELRELMNQKTTGRSNP